MMRVKGQQGFFLHILEVMGRLNRAESQTLRVADMGPCATPSASHAMRRGGLMIRALPSVWTTEACRASGRQRRELIKGKGGAEWVLMRFLQSRAGMT